MNLDLIRKMDRIHPYPAKFTLDLAMDFIQKYTKKNDLVYDPFLGSGTTLLASKLLCRNGIGSDINHIAILISKFKLLNLTDKEIKNLETFINDFSKNYKKNVNSIELFNYPSINHWFCLDSIKILSLIKKYSYTFNSENETIFYKLIMSSIINNASNQDSDTRYAAVFKPKLNIDYVASLFIKKFIYSIELYKEFKKILSYDVSNTPYLIDSKKCCDVLEKESVDLILTSPPYPNTYDYYLYHKHRMNWLDYDVKFSMNNEIGSRREFSSLKHDKEKFNDDIYNILKECNNALKTHSYAIIIIGDGKIRGEVYDAKSNITEICSKLNWKLCDYGVSMLDDTSKSFQQSYRTKGKKEHIFVFKKGE